MAFVRLSSSISNAYSVQAGDQVILYERIYITSETQGIVPIETTDNGVSMYVLGNVITSEEAIYLTGTSTGDTSGVGGNHVVVAETGQVLSLTSDAIFLSGSANSVRSTGYVLGGIFSDGEGFFLSNTGEIRGYDYAMRLMGAGSHYLENAGFMHGVEALLHEEGTASLYNTGLISGSEAAIIQSASAVANVHNSGEMLGGISAAGEINVINTGRMSGDMSGLDAFRNGLGAHVTGAVGISGSSGMFVNLGTVLGNVQDGSDSGIHYNSGAIQGDVTFGGGAVVMTNKGSLSGALTFSTSNDKLFGHLGDVQGAIDASAGNDTLHLNGSEFLVDGGAGTDTVYTFGSLLSVTGVERLYMRGDLDLEAGGDGTASLVVGNNGSNTFTVQGGNDTVFGKLGEDIIYGGDGVDVLNGGGDSDTLWGDAGADTVFGDNGDDWLYGGDGDDLLRGGDGDDVIFAGGGRDIIRGDDGADRFVFANTDDMGLSTNRSLIFDVELGKDVIDLVDINGAVAFEFIAGAAFSGSGGMQLRYAGTSNTLVQVDVDGDGVADGELLLIGPLALTASDFIL